MDDPVPETAVIDPLIPPPRKPSVALGRRWTRVLARASVGVPIALVVLAGTMTWGIETRHSACLVCGSLLTERDYGFGSGLPDGQWVRVWPTTRSIRDSAVLRPLFGPDHRHHWQEFSSSGTGLGGFSSCGYFEPGPLFVCLRLSGDARDHVRSELSAGRLSPQRLEELTLVPDEDTHRSWCEGPSKHEAEMRALLEACEAAAASE